MTKREMIDEIMIVCKASMEHGLDDVFIRLAFRSEQELHLICAQLNINMRV